MSSDEMMYAESHEWTRIEGDTAVIGITDYAVEEVGDIVFVEFEDEKEVAKGETFGILETVKAVFDLYAPVSGKITEFNSEIEENPDIIKEDPFGSGWLVKIACSDENEFDGLMSADAYKEFCQKQE